MKIRIECKDGYKVKIYKGSGEYKIQKPIETRRDILPVYIALLWRKSAFYGIGFGWLGYYLTIKLIK